jgi:4-oxalocrotonate tautomerase
MSALAHRICRECHLKISPTPEEARSAHDHPSYLLPSRQRHHEGGPVHDIEHFAELIDIRRFVMPLTRIDLRRGRSAVFKNALMDEIYHAMRETFDVPEDDRFMTVFEHDDPAFSFGRTYLGIERSDELVIIQITAKNTRTVEKKKALYARLAERLATSPGIRPQDVFVSIIEVPKENWSFGNGLAQYA